MLDLASIVQMVGIKMDFSLKAAVTTSSITLKQAFENANLWSIDVSVVTACVFCRQRSEFSLNTAE